MTSKARFLGLGLGILLIIGAFALVFLQEQGLRNSGVALAQSAPTATPNARPVQPNVQPTAQAQKQAYSDAFWNALAKQLGITVDQLKTKTVAAEKDVIEQMVTDGKITRAQADQMEQNLNTNQPFGFGFRGFPGVGGRGPRGRFPQGQVPNGQGKPFGMGPWFDLNNTTEVEAIAKVLNMQSADMVSQLRSGKTLADLAKTQNVDEAKVKQAIIDTRKAEVQREVTDGLLTQAQADQITTNLTPDKIDLTQPFFGRGGRGHFGH